MLPRFQFSIHLITQALLSSLIEKRVTMAWLYIKPVREVALTNRQVTQSIATQSKRSTQIKDSFLWKKSCLCRSVNSEPTVWSRPGFATQHETLTVFTHLACSQEFLRINLAVGFAGWKRMIHQWDGKYLFLLRCELSFTYHLLPLAKQNAVR